jgi:hypothetical protein
MCPAGACTTPFIISMEIKRQADLTISEGTTISMNKKE